MGPLYPHAPLVPKVGSPGSPREARVSPGGHRVSERALSRLTLHQRLAFLGCSVGIGVFSAFNNFTLTLWLATFTNSYLLLGLLGNTRTFEGAIVSPVAGAASDALWLG